MSLYVFLKYAEHLVLPLGSLVVAAVLYIVLRLLCRPRLAGWVVTLALVETLVLAFPPVGDFLLSPLEDQARAAAKGVPSCCYDAIVVLGGGISPAKPPEREYPDLSDASDRIWHAARLFRAHVAPRIIVSGGSYLARADDPSSTEAEAMRTFLVDLGVPTEAIVSESKSLNTLENMQNVRAMVGDAKVALVTSASHMPRALQLAARAGLKAVPFPTDYQVAPNSRAGWEEWIPSQEGLGNSIVALHELVAIWLDGRGWQHAP